MKPYEPVTIEVIALEGVDVITASGDDNLGPEVG